MKGWHNVKDIAGYMIVEKSNKFYSGMIYDSKGKTINCLGMNMENIGISSNYDITRKITEREYNKLIGIINKNK